ITNGTATLTFTTDDPAGPCPSATDNVIITINPVATVDAGAPQTICSGSTATMAGVIGGSATTATWTTSGDGTFNDATSVTAIYTPGTADLTAGTVTLTLTTGDPAGPCGAVNDNVVITMDPPATVEAGNPQTICSAGIATLAGSSVGGTATTGAWSIVSQPGGGDGLLSDVSQTATPATVTFSATVAGAYTLRLTTNDPAGVCGPVSDDVVITVTSAATVDAGPAQTICVGGSATLAGSFTGTTGITWTSSGDGSFNDPSLVNAIYTPGANDIANNSVTLTITTAGPCAPVNDNVVISIDPAPTVDAGAPQTICSSNTVVLNASFGGSATGLLWTTSGNGTFDDNTDTNATYTFGSNDITNGTVTLTATATGSCTGTDDDVIITINPAAVIDAGTPQTVCVGSTVALDATLSGSATTVTWTTSGDGTFNNINDPDAVYTHGPNDQINGTVTLTATTNNPAGPCPAVNDNVVITFIATPGDQTTAGVETWIGYVYDDAGDPTPIPAKIDFNTTKYRGFIDATDIDNMSGASTYDLASDEFDLNLGIPLAIQGPNVCGSFANFFSIRYKMNKTLAAGIYRFTVGADDGVRLLIDGNNVLPAAAFDFQSYTTYTTAPICLSTGVHEFEIHYFDNTAQSRLTFDFAEVPDLTTTSPVAVCNNGAAPTLTATSTDVDVMDFNWYANGTLVFTGANYTPAGTELDMTTAGTTTFEVTAVYACGETQPTDVDVDVLNSATLVINPETICESGGVVDLRTLVVETPAGGAFVFSGHPNIAGNNFDPSGLAGAIAIAVDYTMGSCTAPQGTLNLTITNSAMTTVPATAVVTCDNAPDIDLTTLVSALPAGGTFTFSGPQVTANSFNPSGLSGVQTITVDYSVGGCTAPQTTFDIDVTTNVSITINNATACENGASLNLLTLVSASTAGGTFTFSGAGVSGNTFDPSGQSGTVNINVDYDFTGCTDNGTLQVTILSPGDPLCTGGNCATVVIVPKPEPATCTNSDGRMVMSIKPFTPTINNTGVKITIDGISSTGLPISRTIFNDSTFLNLPVGAYDYSIEYGDPACIKTGQFSIDQSGTVGTPVVSNVISPVCVGSATGSLTLDVPGETGNVLEWSLDGGLTDPFKPFTAGSQITGIPAGPAPSFQQVISVRRNIADVCYSSVTVAINESVTNITATFGITPATCNGNDGAITNIVPGGGNGAPYTFSIDGGQSFQASDDFNGLAGGTYTLTVRDALGCENDFTANVTFPGFINSAISKNNADCTNGGDSGSISVTVTDLGAFEVALSTDQFNPPADAEYLTYSNPSITFNALSRGQYFVYVKSNSAACPTRSAPINIFGVYDITFDLEAHCNNNELSLALLNVTGESGGAPLEIQVSKKLSTDPPEIIYQQFPADGEIFLDYDDHTFLQTPGEYRIMIIQFQNEVVCNLSSEVVDFNVPVPLSAQVGFVSESYPDIPSGKLHIAGFTGGAYPYDVRIELDSASSFVLPVFSSDFEEAGVNGNQQIEMVYSNIPAGRYNVEVMDSLGCILDMIARVPLDDDIFIPNVFTPNGDGSNDVFFIRNLPPAPTINQLMISNRWGKEVFASENYQNNWEGEGAADGIYFYRLQVEDDALTGWIEIIRGQKP
ncbi:MAG: gliding motility-associated C-terminal domain-containing protein, partial [Cyclobacteriaceae bacterium]